MVTRGYEDVKLDGVAEHRRRVERLLAAIGETPGVASEAASAAAER